MIITISSKNLGVFFKRSILCCIAFGNIAFANARDVRYKVNQTSGAIESIMVDGDTTGMNWIIRPDGSQYRWITSYDGWGLGYFSIGGKEYC